MKCEERILTQLPLAGLAVESVESRDLTPSKQPPVPTVRWADDPVKYRAEWARRNADKMRQYKRNWALRNPEKVRAKRERDKLFEKERNRQHYLRNRAKRIEQAARWKLENRQRANAWTRNYRRGKQAQRAAEARDYRRRNPDVSRNSNKRYRERHAEELRAKRIATYPKRKENARVYGREYWRAKKAILLAKKRERHRTDVRYAIECRLRGQLVKAVARRKTCKAASTFTLLGCSLDDFVKHLESQFLPGMTWDNRNTWEIDHIRPVAAYDLTDPEQQRQCFHWTNLRPLWTDLNRQKQDKIIP